MQKTARQQRLSRGGRAALIAAIFLATACGAFFVGLYFAHSYVATALLIGPSPSSLLNPLNSSNLLSPSNPSSAAASTATSSPEPTLSPLSDDAILAIDTQLYPGLVTTLAPDWAIARTRSYFFITRIPDPASGPKELRITFANHNRDAALRVTGALAAALARASQTPEPSPDADTIPPSAVSPPAVASSTGKTSEPQQSVQSTEQKSPTTLSGLRHNLGQLAQLQASLEQQLLQQSAELATIQADRQRLTSGTRDNQASDRERQLNKHDADEAALRSQLAAATQTMNDLGQRYTADYPEYLNARDRVEELQNSLNQFQSKTFTYVPEAASDNSRRLAELNQQETAIRATLQILQQELDRNQIETKRVQAQVISWSRDNAATSAGSPVRSPLTNSPAPAPGALNAAPFSNSVGGYTILENAAILSDALRISIPILTLISLGFALIAAAIAALLTRPPHKVIKGEEDLENELPARIKYLGSVPRIKHEIISR